MLGVLFGRVLISSMGFRAPSNFGGGGDFASYTRENYIVTIPDRVEKPIEVWGIDAGLDPEGHLVSDL